MVYIAGPYDREHGVLQWGGSLPGGEQWSCSLRLAETQEDGLLQENDAAGWDVQELLDHYTVAVKAYHARSATLIHPNCILEFVKFNRVGVDGRYIDPTTFENTFTPVAGGNSGQQPPNQTAIAVTLLTEVTRGPAARGRFYLPMYSGTLGSDGLIPTGNADSIASSTKTFLELVSDVPGLDTASSPGVVVMSRKSGAPATRRVNGVWVGRVVDTQRRRRRSLVENYRSAVIDQGLL